MRLSTNSGVMIMSKLGDGANNAKSIPLKNSNSALKLKAPMVKIDSLFPQRLKRKEEDTKF